MAYLAQAGSLTKQVEAYRRLKGGLDPIPVNEM